MPFIIEIDPSVTLPNLPPDLVKRIAQMNPESFKSMQLISSSWQTSLADCRPLLPLERVYLCPGLPAVKDDVDYEIPTSEYKTHSELDAEVQIRGLTFRHISMYAVMKAGCSSKVGADSWLKIHEKHDKDAVEVTCEPQCIGLNEDAFVLTLLIAFPFLISIVALFFSAQDTEKRVFGLIGTVVTVLITAAILYHYRGVEERKTRARLSQFFTSFSHIETLVLDHFFFDNFFRYFSWTSFDISLLGNTLNTLGKMNVDRLEIRTNDIDNYTFDKLIKMCKTNNTREVFIQTRKLSATNFSCFATELANLGVILDIYEISCSRFRYYLHKSREDWEKIISDLKADGVSMTMETVHDDSFNQADYPFGVKMHLRCENKKDGAKMALEPVNVGRGFSI